MHRLFYHPQARVFHSTTSIFTLRTLSDVQLQSSLKKRSLSMHSLMWTRRSIIIAGYWSMPRISSSLNFLQLGICMTVTAPLKARMPFKLWISLASNLFRHCHILDAPSIPKGPDSQTYYTVPIKSIRRSRVTGFSIWQRVTEVTTKSWKISKNRPKRTKISYKSPS